MSHGVIPFLDLRKVNESFQPALRKAVQRVVDSGSYIRGDAVRQFEKSYASFTGCSYCVGTGNGFDALKLIFRAWMISGELREGDEVIVPANTYIASILAIGESGLTPVLVEPDPQTLNIDSSRIEEKITQRTRAMLVVHLYGRCGMNADIQNIAVRYKLKLVEDNAQAAGCIWSGQRTGSLGDAAAHSFFPTKNLGALGDGGAVTTNDADLERMIRTLGNYGSHAKGMNDVKGVNSRLDEIQAAALSVKLSRLDSDNDRRRAIAEYYLANIRNTAITLPSNLPLNEQGSHVWHLFVVRCVHRDKFQQHLREQGVETLVHYPVPPHRQGAFREWNSWTLPITEAIHREVVSLPLHPVLEDSEVEVVADAVNRYKA